LLRRLHAEPVGGTAGEEAGDARGKVDSVNGGGAVEVVLVGCNGRLRHGGGELGLVHVGGLAGVNGLEHVGSDIDGAVGEIFVEDVAANGDQAASAFKALDCAEDAAGATLGRHGGCWDGGLTRRMEGLYSDCTLSASTDGQPDDSD